MTVVAEPHLESESLRLITERTTEYVMPFKPLPGVAYKALGRVLLYDAIHYSSPRRILSNLLLGQVGAEVSLLLLGLSHEPPLVVTASIHPLA